MEMLDIIKKDRLPTGRTLERGAPLENGDYHLVVHVWIKCADGRYLISKRAPEKSFAGLWECTGGAAVAGETSLEAALREAREELGVILDPENGRLIKTCVFDDIGAICDVWQFEQEIQLCDVRLQEGETCDAKLAYPVEILDMRRSGTFITVYDYVEELFACFT
jgi:8-oxo-dGTP pyrophosphatase MutT (NUDIX family)